MSKPNSRRNSNARDDEQTADDATLRHRGAEKQTARTTPAADASSEASVAAAAASAGAAVSSHVTEGDQLKVTHINQGASRSSAHICSNKQSCPLIAAFEAAVDSAAADALPLSDNLYACSACNGAVLYCSLECQRKDWDVDGKHKQHCPAMRAAYEERHGEKKPAAVATSAAAPATAQRNVRINLDVRFGPRTIIVIALLLYLIYRYYPRAAQHDDASASL